VWIGFDNPAPLFRGRLATGGTLAAPIWGQVMQAVPRDSTAVWAAIERLDAMSAPRLTPGCPAPPALRPRVAVASSDTAHAPAATGDVAHAATTEEGAETPPLHGPTDLPVSSAPSQASVRRALDVLGYRCTGAAHEPEEEIHTGGFFGGVLDRLRNVLGGTPPDTTPR
jgi:hypothetical protein